MLENYFGVIRYVVYGHEPVCVASELWSRSSLTGRQDNDSKFSTLTCSRSVHISES